MLVLRSITKQDASIFMNLRNGLDTYHWFFSNRQFTLQEVENWITNLNLATDLVFVVEEEGKVIGTCSAYNIKSNTAEIGRIIVTEGMRGRGIGTLILQEINRLMAIKGFVKLWAEIKMNNIRSIKVFEKAGYTRASSSFTTEIYTYELVLVSKATKKCCQCKKKKEITNFVRDKDRRDGLSRRCRECQQKYSKASYLRHKDYYKNERKQNKSRHSKLTKDRRRLTRLAVLEAYGKSKCALCGTTDIRVLDLDHVNGGGGQERRKIPYLLEYLYTHNFPNKDKYRVLCKNCNWISWLESKKGKSLQESLIRDNDG